MITIVDELTDFLESCAMRYNVLVGYLVLMELALTIGMAYGAQTHDMTLFTMISIAFGAPVLLYAWFAPNRWAS